MHSLKEILNEKLHGIHMWRAVEVVQEMALNGYFKQVSAGNVLNEVDAHMDFVRDLENSITPALNAKLKKYNFTP